MEYAQHHDAFAGNAITKNIFRSQHLQHDLPVLSTPSNRVTKLRMCFQHLCLGQDFASNDSGERWVTFLQKNSKAIEVGESRRRPFELHRSCHGLNVGVPQVSSHRATFSCATVGSPASTAAQRRSSSASSSESAGTCASMKATRSATTWPTLTPRDAACASRSSAVRSSTSMVFIRRE